MTLSGLQDTASLQMHIQMCNVYALDMLPTRSHTHACKLLEQGLRDIHTHCCHAVTLEQELVKDHTVNGSLFTA